MWWVINATPRPFYPRNNRAPVWQEADWAPGPVCAAVENLLPSGAWSTDRPVRTESNFKKYWC